MKHPRITIKPQPVDLLIELLGMISLCLLFLLPLVYMNRLPDEIPVHFKLSGQPDRYSEKGSLWIFPLVSLFLYAALTAVNRFPHVFNYPVKVTEENAERLYRIGTRTLRILKTLLVTMFLYAMAYTLNFSTGKQAGPVYIIMPGFVILILALTAGMFYKMIKNK
jgi:uncharacterized membrane protein